MATPQKVSSQRPRGIYLLPNLFTTAGLFAGFFAIVKAMKGEFDFAAIGIFTAMVADFLDGRVARLTHTQTAFGGQYDSLSDMVAFGVAPALVVYNWSLHSLGKFGWLSAFIFTAAGALRLARFNTQLGDNSNKRYFQGLAIPSGAGVIASVVWFGDTYGELNVAIDIVIAVLTMSVAGLMVSNIRYRSFKDIDLKGRIRFFSLLLLVLIFVGIAIDPPTILLLIFVGYALSGPMHTLWRKHKVRLDRLLRRKRGNKAAK